MKRITVQGHELEYVRLRSSHPRDDAPAMVFLHEGLGSISLWRDFPQRVADATGCEAVVYSRYGYGRSAPLEEKRTTRYMHTEGLESLPEFLDRLGLERPFLFGHSDGGSIALLHAGSGHQPISGAVVVAPHVFVEQAAIDGITATGDMYRQGDLRSRLARHHEDVDGVFWNWHDTWLSDEFRRWNIEEFLPRISCQVLAVQGEDDEYGTMEQLDRISAQVGDVEQCRLADCRHSPHRDQAEALIEATAQFVARILQ